MGKINDTIREEVREVILNFFVDECEVELSELIDNTNIFDDIGGDSLMYLELVEILKEKYKLDIELKTIGKYSVKHPVKTIGELIDMQLLIIEHGNKIGTI